MDQVRWEEVQVEGVAGIPQGGFTLLDWKHHRVRVKARQEHSELLGN